MAPSVSHQLLVDQGNTYVILESAEAQRYPKLAGTVLTHYLQAAHSRLHATHWEGRKYRIIGYDDVVEVDNRHALIHGAAIKTVAELKHISSLYDYSVDFEKYTLVTTACSILVLLEGTPLASYGEHAVPMLNRWLANWSCNAVHEQRLIIITPRPGSWIPTGLTDALQLNLRDLATWFRALEHARAVLLFEHSIPVDPVDLRLVGLVREFMES